MKDYTVTMDKPKCYEGRTWQRIDTYHSETNTYLDGNSDRLFCAGADDYTPCHDERYGYNPKCSCCWLGFPHTEAHHEAAIG